MACNGSSNLEKHIGGYVECQLCRTWVNQVKECSGLKKQWQIKTPLSAGTASILGPGKGNTIYIEQCIRPLYPSWEASLKLIMQLLQVPTHCFFTI